MKTIVIYKTSAGFTKKYAEIIAKELNCDYISLKETTSSKLESYDTIIYGGGIRANMINGLDKIKKLTLGDKKLFIFAVGATEKTDDFLEEIKKVNKTNLEDLPFYYFRGGININNLRGMEKLIINTIKRSLSKKKDLVKKDKDMLEMLLNPCDFTNTESTDMFISVVKNS